jgi:hypothetical protein
MESKDRCYHAAEESKTPGELFARYEIARRIVSFLPELSFKEFCVKYPEVMIPANPSHYEPSERLLALIEENKRLKLEQTRLLDELKKSKIVKYGWWVNL